MSAVERLLENSRVYSLWQAPFAERKLTPLLAHNDLSQVRRVLDVGCGPGTNTAHFNHSDYLGIDINGQYVRDARRRHGREFLVADVTKYRVGTGERFDFVLLNSLLHHLDPAGTAHLLSHVAELLAEDGHVHIIDMVLPPEQSLARRLAQWDRGDYPRLLEEWLRIFGKAFEPVVIEPFPLRVFGVTLWNMIYFKGRARRA